MSRTCLASASRKFFESIGVDFSTLVGFPEFFLVEPPADLEFPDLLVVCLLDEFLPIFLSENWSEKINFGRLENI